MISLSPTIPVAFHAEQFSYKTFTFVAFGLDEQDGFGNPWEEFYRHCHGMSHYNDRTAQSCAQSLAVDVKFWRPMQASSIFPIVQAMFRFMPSKLNM